MWTFPTGTDCFGAVSAKRETETELTEMEMDVVHDLIKHSDVDV